MLFKKVLDEIAWLMIVLAVPISYVVASLARGCFKAGRESEVEMNKVDKIYQEVILKEALTYRGTLVIFPLFIESHTLTPLESSYFIHFFLYVLYKNPFYLPQSHF